METFEEKIEGFSIVFCDALKKFDEETTPHILGIIARQVCLADEFKKASTNIKLAC